MFTAYKHKFTAHELVFTDDEKNSGDVCKLLKYRDLERKIDGDDLN